MPFDPMYLLIVMLPGVLISGFASMMVRSAFNRLRREGYAIVANEGEERRRLVVAPITAEDAADLFHIVGELEGLAGYYAAGVTRERRVPFVSELKKLNDQMLVESQASKMDTYKVFQLDASFHRRYVVEAAPPRLLNLHDVIKPQAERYARLYVAALTEVLDLSVAEHERIINAVEEGDPDAAQRAIQTNWRNAARRVATLIAEWGESGGW